MRLLVRRDAPLAAALICAALVVFQDSFRRLLDFARQVETSYHLELVPGLVILIVMFGFHQYAKYQETKRLAASAEAETRQLRERTRELEQLSRCGQVLGRALSLDALRVAVWRYLPEILTETEPWLALVRDGHWEVLADTRSDSEAWWSHHTEEIARVADERTAGEPSPFAYERCWCYPLIAHDAVVGLLGIAKTEIDPPARLHRLIEALGSLLAIAIHNVQLFAQIKTESTRDPLTGCLRRVPAMEMITTELRRARRVRSCLSVIMFDLDGFKQVNDQHGHQSGDRLLADVGRLVNRQLRSSDVKCRYGGDEFLLILPETAAAGAHQVAEALRVAVGALAVNWRGQQLKVTASVGIATSDEQDDTEQLIARADAALYAAKRAGRNCVRTDGANETTVTAAAPASADSRSASIPAIDPNRKCA
jgi:diguanylate cyclase (GGDEF)-like protein